ncbi:MAG TPA: hypothetical protein VHB53_00365 [Solirubrobacterales bacterium]|nr:hypothetical protein [Solirubrobacterales bacterium]
MPAVEGAEGLGIPPRGRQQFLVAQSVEVVDVFYLSKALKL